MIWFSADKFSYSASPNPVLPHWIFEIKIFYTKRIFAMILTFQNIDLLLFTQINNWVRVVWCLVGGPLSVKPEWVVLTLTQSYKTPVDSHQMTHRQGARTEDTCGVCGFIQQRCFYWHRISVAPQTHWQDPPPRPHSAHSGTPQPQLGSTRETFAHPVLFNIPLKINWPQVITSDKNEALYRGDLVPAGRVSGTIDELTDCHSESRLTLEAGAVRIVWARHLLGGSANAVDFLRPLMDEDMQLFARVVRFPDDSL